SVVGAAAFRGGAVPGPVGPGVGVVDVVVVPGADRGPAVGDGDEACGCGPVLGDAGRYRVDVPELVVEGADCFRGPDLDEVPDEDPAEVGAVHAHAAGQLGLGPARGDEGLEPPSGSGAVDRCAVAEVVEG